MKIIKVLYTCKDCDRWWVREVPEEVKCVYWMFCECGNIIDPGVNGELAVLNEVEL